MFLFRNLLKVSWVSNVHTFLKADSSAMTGTNVAVTVVTKQDGGIMLDPIPGDMLRTIHSDHQVRNRNC